MQIIIDIPDWLNEHYRMEEKAITVDDFVRLAVENGLETAQIARLYIVQRELGLVEDDIMPDNKTLLQSGGRESINWAFRRRKIEIEVNGKTYGARELIGSIADDENGNSHAGRETQEQGATFESTASAKQEPAACSWSVLGSPGARDKAIKSLHRDIPGRIVGRFLVIHASEGDVQTEADWLIDKVGEIAAEFAKPGTE